MNGREIEFRAWNHSMKRMSVSFSLQRAIQMQDNIGISRTDEYMQWTGLKDKNGKKVFEGDIVSAPEYGERLFEVCFGEFKDENGLRHNGWFIGKADELDLCYTDLTVLGNIFENPSLLEVDPKK